MTNIVDDSLPTILCNYKVLSQRLLYQSRALFVTDLRLATSETSKRLDESVSRYKKRAIQGAGADCDNSPCSDRAYWTLVGDLWVLTTVSPGSWENRPQWVQMLWKRLHLVHTNEDYKKDVYTVFGQPVEYKDANLTIVDLMDDGTWLSHVEQKNSYVKEPLIYAEIKPHLKPTTISSITTCSKLPSTTVYCKKHGEVLPIPETGSCSDCSLENINACVSIVLNKTFQHTLDVCANFSTDEWAKLCNLVEVERAKHQVAVPIPLCGWDKINGWPELV